MLGPLRSWIPMETQAGKNPQVDAVGQFPTKKAASVLKPSQNLCGALGTLQCRNIYLCVGQFSVHSNICDRYSGQTRIVHLLNHHLREFFSDPVSNALHAQFRNHSLFPTQTTATFSMTWHSRMSPASKSLKPLTATPHSKPTFTSRTSSWRCLREATSPVKTACPWRSTRKWLLRRNSPSRTRQPAMLPTFEMRKIWRTSACPKCARSSA